MIPNEMPGLSPYTDDDASEEDEFESVDPVTQQCVSSLSAISRVPRVPPLLKKGI